MARKTLKDALLAQRQADLQRRYRKARDKAIKSARFSDRDKGRIVFIDTQGRKRTAPGARGFYVRITKEHGRVYRINSAGGRPPAPRRRLDIDLPEGRYSRLVLAARKRELRRDRGGHVLTWGKGEVGGKGQKKGLGPGSDYQKKLVRSLATAFRKKGASGRKFQVNVSVVVKDSEGKRKTVELSIPISRADHVKVGVNGLKGWVNQKTLAALGQALLYHGKVTRGSANHIREANENRENFDGEYLDKHGNVVDFDDLDVVDVEGVQWQIDESNS